MQVNTNRSPRLYSIAHKGGMQDNSLAKINFLDYVHIIFTITFTIRASQNVFCAPCCLTYIFINIPCFISYIPDGTFNSFFIESVTYSIFALMNVYFRIKTFKRNSSCSVFCRCCYPYCYLISILAECTPTFIRTLSFPLFCCCIYCNCPIT